jgi:hypothetical protein
MRHLTRAPERPTADTEAGAAPATPTPRRRTLGVCLLAAVTVTAALAAVSGPARAAARPASTPPPPCNAASSNPSGASTTVVRPCPPPPCETTPAASPSGRLAPRPALCPAPRGMVVLTEKDGGRTVTVHDGTRIAVHLSGGGVWSAPASSDGRIVTRVAAGRGANGDAHGRFRAAGTGTADLTATEAPRCAPMCKVLTRFWIVHIVVQ